MNNETPLKLVYHSFDSPGQLWTTGNDAGSLARCKSLIMLQIQLKGHCNGVGFVSPVKHTVEFELGTSNSECYAFTHRATLPQSLTRNICFILPTDTFLKPYFPFSV